MTPFTPYVCEELWEKLGGEGFASTSAYPTADETKINTKAEAAEEMLVNLLADIQNILAVAKVSPKKINLYLAPKWKRRVYGMIKEGGGVKDIMADPDLKKHGKEAAKLAQTRTDQVPEIVFSLGEEYEFLDSAAGFLEKEFGCEIVVQKQSAHDPEGKTKHALPGKPGIYIE